MRFVVSRGGSSLSRSFSSTISNVLVQTTEGGLIAPGGALAGDALAGDALASDVLAGDALTGDALTGDPLTGGTLNDGALTGGAGVLTGDMLTDDVLSDAVLTGGAMTGVKDEPFTSGGEGEPQSTEGTAVMAVTIPPAIRGLCICWAEDSECELQGRGNTLGTTGDADVAVW